MSVSLLPDVHIWLQSICLELFIGQAQWNFLERMLLEEGVRVYKYSPEENAMAIVLEPKTSYNLISREESNNNKILIHVKLTDSCLRALEDYESAEVLAVRIFFAKHGLCNTGT